MGGYDKLLTMSHLHEIVSLFVGELCFFYTSKDSDGMFGWYFINNMQSLIHQSEHDYWAWCLAQVTTGQRSVIIIHVDPPGLDCINVFEEYSFFSILFKSSDLFILYPLNMIVVLIIRFMSWLRSLLLGYLVRNKCLNMNICKCLVSN